MSLLQLISKRQSIRKYSSREIPMEDLQKILEAAGQAPSAKNIQNWHFVVVTNPEKIAALADAVENKNKSLADQLQDEKLKNSFTKFLRFGTFFKHAPAVIFAYAKDNYEPTGLPVLQTIGADENAIQSLIATHPAMQSLGAAIQNLTLSATALGYGTCWMTSANYAATEISELLDFKKDDYFLAAVIPVGIPAGDPKSPSRKPLNEIATFLK